MLAEQLAARKASLHKGSEISEELQLQPEAFDQSRGVWRANCAPELAVNGDEHVGPLRCLSFNLMKERDHLAPRMAALVALIEREDPALICLQENTAHHEAHLAAAPFVRARFWRSPFAGQGPGFKVSLYSRLPLDTRAGGLLLHHLRGRPCVTAFLSLGGRDGTATAAVSSVHLTSGRNAGVRRSQARGCRPGEPRSQCCSD